MTAAPESLLGVVVVLEGLIEAPFAAVVVEGGEVVAVKRSDISFSAVTFLTKNVLIVPRSALRRSFIS